jgi:nitrogen-specific signal transduction histidine kinase
MNVADAADFYVSVLDSLSQQIAVIDAQGFIQWVNLSWRTLSAHSDDLDRLFRSIATTCSDGSRPLWLTSSRGGSNFTSG